ncbi:TraC family protein [Desulfurobacterium sp. TC5-1]|uniref:TraC family protein n=1 Tax=Desulfurobacterium sp. TC5-1 TaxID=1158318 RepID=UPI0003B51044|nr:TraC family protein [Desulfurobacterium sp. TC5-1]
MTETSVEKEKFYELLDRETLSKYLPYVAYDPRFGVYVTSDEGAGIVFECFPLSAAGERTMTMIEGMIESLPVGATLNFFLFASRNLKDITRVYRSLKRTDEELLKVAIEQHAGFFENHSKEIISRHFPITVRNFRLIVSVKLKHHSKVSSFLKLFKKEQVTDFSQLLKEAGELKNKIEGSLRAMGLSPVQVAPERLIQIMSEVININHDENEHYRNYNEDEYINTQIVAYDTKVEVEEDYFVMDNQYWRSLSVSAFPKEWHLGDMTKLLGDMFFNENNFKYPFILSFTVVRLSEDETAKIKRNAALVMSQVLPGGLFPKLKAKQEDLAIAMNRLEEGKKLFSCCLSLLVSAPFRDELQKQIDTVKTFWRTAGFQIFPDRYISFPVFLSALPLAGDKELLEELKRDKIFFSDNVASFSPVEAEFIGTGTPQILFVSRRGQLVGVDLFDSPTNYNAFVIGTSGAGKSVLMQLLSFQYRAAGATVFINDIGRSYENFCKVMGGQWLEFDPENPICINPFSLVTSQEELSEFMEFLTNVIYIMGAPKSREMSDRLEKLIKAELERAIRTLYQQYGSNLSITHIADYFSALRDSRMVDFGKTLEPYTGRGQYGRFFEGKAEVDFRKPLVVVEYDHLEDVPELRNPVIMMVNFFISRKVYIESKRHKGFRSIVLYDEAHKFLGDPRIDGFIEQLYRRARKHGTAVVIGTQGFEDLWESGSRAGRIIVQNSSFNIFMKQQPTSINALKKSEVLNLSDFEWMLMESIAPVKGEYSEAFLMTPFGRSLVRVVLDRFMYYLFTTDKKDREKISSLMDEKGMTLPEAIQYCVEMENGNGS